MRKQHDVKDEVNRMLANEISNLRLHLEDSRKHHLGRTSEQRSLLNNRNIDKFAMNNPNMTVLTRRTVITIPMVKKPAVILLPMVHSPYRTISHQEKRDCTTCREDQIEILQDSYT